MRRTIVIYIIFALVAAVSIYAQTVEVALVQAIADDEEKTQRSSQFVLSGIMDGLFEAGFICTNVEPVQGNKRTFAAYKAETQAREAYIDYVLVVFAEYAKKDFVPVCSYRLLRVSDGKEMAKGSVPFVKAISDARSDIDSACEILGKSIVPLCKQHIAGASSHTRRVYGNTKA